ncbi:MAG: pyridoxine 5'-phosphate synthase [Bacteroidales bacterium]|jgi:pyridoxine 5-phosphate synthase|nr:pyridoxine 5'-phosphate synthase [Bacteroidales bacterium]
MTKLSVNINKFATLRNARGGNMPDILKAALDCEKYGAQGITVHPRPDERHIRYNDVVELKPILATEFNIEGNPVDSFIKLVLENRPAQVTLVPDAHDAITSNCGWDTRKNNAYLKKICKIFSGEGIRTSVFVDPDTEMVKYAADIGCDRVELYTESYAAGYASGKRDEAVIPFIKAAEAAKSAGIGLNAGHDLNLDNLKFFSQSIPDLLEVSIGHALVCEAIYLGLENTIQAYLRQLKNY